MVNRSPLYGDKGLKVDLISVKNTLQTISGVNPLKGGQIQNGRPPTKRKQINCLYFNDLT